MQTRHAQIRAQQRGIPPLIEDLLDRYGTERYDGCGAVTEFFDKSSLRNMEREMGREPVRCLAAWHSAYKVLSIRDGVTITIGRRTKRIWRK